MLQEGFTLWERYRKGNGILGELESKFQVIKDFKSGPWLYNYEGNLYAFTKKNHRKMVEDFQLSVSDGFFGREEKAFKISD